MKTRKLIVAVLFSTALLAGCGSEAAEQQTTIIKGGEVVTTTVEKPTTTEVPTTTVEKPTTTEVLTTTVEKPTTTAEVPTTTAEEPTTTAEVPTTTEVPTATVEEPTTTPATSEGVKLAETDIPGIYWREEYIGEEYGWYGEFMVINSDGTVYTWVQAEEGSDDAKVFKITKITPYDSEAVSYGGNGDYLIYGGDDIIIYSSNSGGTSFAGYDYAVSEGGRSYRQGRMPEGYYVPGNVVFEMGKPSTTTPSEEPTTPVEEPTTTPVEEPTTSVEEPTTTPAEEPTTPAKYKLDGDTLVFYGGNLVDKEVVNSALEEYKIARTDLKKVVIEAGVLKIGNEAFFDCGNLTSIELPNGMMSIGAAAFGECFSLTSIDIPVGMISIGDWSFFNCGSLTSVKFSDSVMSIGMFAFGDCYSLTSVAIPDSVTNIGECAFEGCGSLTAIHASAGSYAETWAMESGYMVVNE